MSKQPSSADSSSAIDICYEPIQPGELIHTYDINLDQISLHVGTVERDDDGLLFTVIHTTTQHPQNANRTPTTFELCSIVCPLQGGFKSAWPEVNLRDIQFSLGRLTEALTRINRFINKKMYYCGDPSKDEPKV